MKYYILIRTCYLSSIAFEDRRTHAGDELIYVLLVRTFRRIVGVEGMGRTISVRGTRAGGR